MCLFPTFRKNKKYTATKKNGGNIPAVVDKRVLYVPTGCGQCMECTKQKEREYRVRLLEEVKNNKTKGYFLTLTFSTEAIQKLSAGIHKLEGYDLDNEIATIAMRKYNERYRKKTGKALRHWGITELGEGRYEHLHIHMIIWPEDYQAALEKWQYGHIWEGEYVNEATANYITKYCTKKDEKHKEYKPKVFSSPGIGKGYIGTHNAKKNKYKPNDTKESYTTRDGTKMALPIYYRNNIYTEEEREKLWLEKLDKGIRYVDGKEIPAHREDIYDEAVKWARIKNRELGFGDNSINWDRKKYERERRNLIHKKRLGGEPPKA